MQGEAADLARIAQQLERQGDIDAAVVLLECTLDAVALEDPVLPWWICGRLAALFRRQKRYYDELTLLERYRASQRDEEARARFDARLVKARILADRYAAQGSGALDSVREVSARRPLRRLAVATSCLEVEAHEATADLVIEIATNAITGGATTLDPALAPVAQARSVVVPDGQLLVGVRTRFAERVKPEGLTDAEWASVYRAAILLVLQPVIGD